MSEKAKLGKVIRLLGSPQKIQPPFRPGEFVPMSGIYRAFHGDHRLAHEITLLSGHHFPRCKKCGDLVQFELVSAAPASIHDRDFRVDLYEIPHPDDEALPTSVAS